MKKFWDRCKQVQKMPDNKLKFNLAVSFQHLALGSLVSSFYLYAQQNSINLVELTWLGLLTAVLSFVIEPITSLMADVYGKKPVLLIGYGFLFLSFAALIWGGNSITSWSGNGGVNFGIQPSSTQILNSPILAFTLQQISICFSLAFLSGTEESFLSDIVKNDIVKNAVVKNAVVKNSDAKQTQNQEICLKVKNKKTETKKSGNSLKTLENNDFLESKQGCETVHETENQAKNTGANFAKEVSENTTETEKSSQTLVSSLALMQIFDEVGTILGTFLIGFLGGFVGFRLGYVMSLVSSLIGFILIFGIAHQKSNFQNSQSKQRQEQKSGFLEIQTIEDKKPENKTKNQTQTRKWQSILQINLRNLYDKVSKYNWKIILIITLLFVLSIFRGEESWQISMNQIGINFGIIGLIFSLGKSSSLLSSSLIYRWHHKIDQKVAIILGFTLQAAAYFCFLQNNLYTSGIAIIIFFFGENLLRPYIKNLIFENSPDNLKTTFLSIISGFGNLLKFPFVFVLSYLMDKNYLHGLWLMLFVKILSVILVFIIFQSRIFRSK